MVVGVHCPEPGVGLLVWAASKFLMLIAEEVDVALLITALSACAVSLSPIWAVGLKDLLDCFGDHCFDGGLCEGCVGLGWGVRPGG